MSTATNGCVWIQCVESMWVLVLYSATHGASGGKHADAAVLDFGLAGPHNVADSAKEATVDGPVSTLHSTRAKTSCQEHGPGSGRPRGRDATSMCQVLLASQMTPASSRTRPTVCTLRETFRTPSWWIERRRPKTGDKGRKSACRGRQRKGDSYVYVPVGATAVEALHLGATADCSSTCERIRGSVQLCVRPSGRGISAVPTFDCNQSQEGIPRVAPSGGNSGQDSPPRMHPMTVRVRQRRLRVQPESMAAPGGPGGSHSSRLLRDPASMLQL